MLTYTPPKNKVNGYFSMTLVVAGLFMFSVSSFVDFIPYVLQLIGLVLIVFALQVMQRYVLSDFLYIIDDRDDGDSVLNVIKIQGNRKTTVCSISLIKCVFAGQEENNTYRFNNSFDYRQNVFSDNEFIVIYTENEESVRIKLEADDALATAIVSRVHTI